MTKQEVSQVQIDPERLRELLEKQNILDAWMADTGIEFLFDLARSKQIDIPSMVHICDTGVAIAQMQSKGIPLSTALIVGDPMHISTILPKSSTQLVRNDHIRRMRSIVTTMAKLVDGLVLGYVVDKHGYVRDIHRLEIDLDGSVNFLLPPLLRLHATISQRCDAVVFLVPPGGQQVRVFAEGGPVGRYVEGSWFPLSWIDEVLAQLVEERNYDLALLQRILRCALQMSTENLEAIFLLGNANTILDHIDAPEISAFAITPTINLDELTDRELINYARQEGASVINTQGQLCGAMMVLRPAAATQPEIDPGQETRHSSTAKISAETQCLGIVVSQNGSITIYESGRQIVTL